MATDTAADPAEVEKLYQYGERLNEAKDKSQVRLPLRALPGFPITSLFLLVCPHYFLFCLMSAVTG